MQQRKARLVLASAAAAGLALGTAATAAGAGHHSNNVAKSVTYKVNARGQKVGPLVAGASTVPDLIPIALDGAYVSLNSEGMAAAAASGAASQGYIYSSDFVGPEASNPSEAAKLMKTEVDVNGDIWIPVYASDGTTVLGRVNTGHVDFGGTSP